MQNAYLEPSAINRLVENCTLPVVVRDKLAAVGVRPVVGVHVIFELARTFLSSKGIAKGKELFVFLRDLEPCYSPSSSNFLVQEVMAFRTSSAVLPFHSYIDQVATRSEVGRLALGNLDDVARKFIDAKEAERRSYKQSMLRYMNDVIELRQRNPKAVPHFKTFGAIVNHFQPKIPSMITEILGGRISPFEAEQLSESINKYPALRNSVRANLYLMWICIRKKAVPNLDKLDDYKQIIEACYCDAIVSRDKQLVKTIPIINPGMKTLSYTEVFN